MDRLQFYLNRSLWAIRFFSHNLFCVVLLLCFSAPPFHLPLFPLFVFPNPVVCLLFSISLCVVSSSLITFSHTLHGFYPPRLSASLIPLPICVFLPLSLASASFSSFVHIFYSLFLSQLECDNFITVIQKVNDTIIVCGTNAGSPRCWMLVRESSDIPWNAYKSLCSCSLRMKSQDRL